MKKTLASVLVMFVLLSTLPLAANAQQTCRVSKKKSNYGRNYVNQNYYRESGNRSGNRNRKPSFYRRHRNLVNIGLASGGGAIVGGVIGGRKGMLTGALIGGGAGALYTYVLKKKKKRY